MKEKTILKRMEEQKDSNKFYEKFGKDSGLTLHKLRQSIEKVKNPKEIRMTSKEKKRLISIFKWLETRNIKTLRLIEDIKQFDGLPIKVDNSIDSFQIVS